MQIHSKATSIPLLKTGVALYMMLPLGSFLLLAGEKPKDLAVVRTEFLGSVWNQAHADASVVAQDGGYSYPVLDGTLWWFGDTFRGSRDESGRPAPI